MAEKPVRQFESGRNKLIVSFLLLLLLAILLSSSWSKESEYNELVHRESTPFSSALGIAVVDRIVFACAVLGCALITSKKPKLAFGVASAIGAALVLWSLRDGVVIGNAFAFVKILGERFGGLDKGGDAYATEVVSLLLIQTGGCICIGIFLLSFSAPAFNTARKLEGVGAGSLLPTGSYGSIMSGKPAIEQKEPLASDPKK